ncbi:flagellar basal body L-ring protein FlgH [Azospirillum sp.]|uniref:flagellar basal body L-ring protein FlgH n=1 Tax=Azospirillum sp. TaxID=34012 RepID=UPI002D3B1221|nr:flagellar basal body L-ring protein FlgH [Azospirillum sp.]HYF86349.1 flagellar basal body L-ring protein FlgH [Azospirillum sp.]
MTARPALRIAARLTLAAAFAASLSACNSMTRLSEVGSGPQLSQIRDPYAQPGYQPVSLPMPTPMPAERNPNSLWRSGSKAFFKDQRAKQVGDILTVLITINDQAQMNNQSTKSRDNEEAMGLPNLLGLQSQFKNALPSAVDPSKLIDATSTSSSQGKGAITRKEQIELKVAALITQTLPNGNLVIQGRQEVRVNYELRDLNITGVIRPEDITAQNTISYEKIAEARIAYGGRGQLSDVQQPRYGQQIFDIISPF